MAITNEMIEETYLEPGALRYYSLDDLKNASEGERWDEWGICGYERHFWAGMRVFVEGKDLLCLSLLDVFDKKEEEYSEQEDGEVYLMLGTDETGAFKWFLLNQEEFEENERHYASCS